MPPLPPDPVEAELDETACDVEDDDETVAVELTELDACDELACDEELELPPPPLVPASPELQPIAGTTKSGARK